LDCNTITVIGGMISNPPEPSRQACARYLHTNLGDPDSYPGLREAADRLGLRVLEILGAPGASWGFTSGATEANTLALYYWREQGRTRVVTPNTAHYSVAKAARILGMDHALVDSRRNILQGLEAALDERSVLVLTVGTTEEGLVDPVESALAIAERAGAVVHVDAAFAGLIARWLPEPVYLAPRGPLATVAVDLHKLGEAPMPLGIIVARSKSIIESLYFDSPYIPSKRQFGLLGSRPGCPVFAAHASLDYLEARFGSFQGMARALMEAAHALVGELKPYGYSAGELFTPIVCLEHPEINSILGYLQARGIKAYTCRGGRGVRIAVMPHHIYTGEIKCIGKHLKEAAEHTG